MKKEVKTPDSYPEWIPQDAFEEFMVMRKKIRKPLTDYAVQLAIRTLDRLRSEGHDPRAVLEQSILNSWQGLFPVRSAATQSPIFRGVK